MPLLFTENETNFERVFGSPNHSPYVKDGINNFVVNGKVGAVNPEQKGTKVAAHYRVTVAAGGAKVIRLRLSPADLVDWLRHPHRVALGLPRWAPELPAQMPAWAPGAWAARRTPPPALRHVPRSEPSFSSNVTPGLARQTETDGAAADDDALGATLRWLAARRGTRGDVG